MPTDYYVVDFPLKPNLEPQTIDFLPFGTRTLKIRVTNPDRIPGRLILRSEHLPEEFGIRRFYTHEQGGTHFRLSWGGGREKGACIVGHDIMVQGKKVPIQECRELLDNSTSYVYLNLNHRDGPIDQTYQLRLAVYCEEDCAEDVDLDQPLASLDLQLTPPQQIHAGEVNNPVRLAQNGQAYSFVGEDIPIYLDRWWSPKFVHYGQDLLAPPLLSFKFKKNLLRIEDAERSGREKRLAQVQDNILFQDVIDEARDFNAELYHFTEHYFVLRLWFSWLEKHGTVSVLDEIPDAERFDLLIDSHKHRVVYAATDFHWRETWVPVPPSRRLYVKAHIGLFSDHGLSFIRSKLPLLGSNYDGWLEWMETLVAQDQGQNEVRIPSKFVRLAVEERLKAEDLGANVEAHVPYFENCERPESVDFISSDPTKG